MKLRNKLILSCAALAAVATTAVSTTYAWYTSNDSVKASGINAQTSQTDDTLLLISKTGKSGSWGAKVDLEYNNPVIDPVSYDATNGFKLWDPANNTEGEAAVANTNYLSFYLYFKSGSSANLQVKVKSFTLTNTATATQGSSLPTKSVLAEGTTSTASTYSVDMLRALNIAVAKDSGTEVAASAENSPVNAAATESRTAYNCNSLAGTDSLTGKTAAATDSTWASKYNAHHYYNIVKGLTTDGISESKLYSESTTDIATFATTGFVVGETGAGANASGLDSMLMVRFDIYLDGWNAACFDAVRQQGFTLSMEFDAATVQAQNQGGNGGGN